MMYTTIRTTVSLYLCLATRIGSLHAGDPIQVGVAETDITPPVGFPIAGYFHERLATGVADPLKAKAIVFRGGDQRAALVVCDLCSVNTDLARAVRKRASERTGIPFANIVVSATHSHTSPAYSKDLYLHLQGKLKNEKRAKYLEKLMEGPAVAIAEAAAAAAPADLQCGSTTQETPIAFNRRFVLRDGSVRTWMKLSSPEVVRAAGPIDPEVGLVLFRSYDDKKPRGLLSNFALHPDTVGGTKFSGDFSYFVEKSVRAKLGKDVVSVFAQGTCGDINHVDPTRSERNKTEFIGTSLGSTIVAGLGSLQTLERTDLRVGSRVVKLPIREVSKTELEEAERNLAAIDRNEKVNFFDQVRARQRKLRQFLRHGVKPGTADHAETGPGWRSKSLAKIGDAIPVEVNTICVGDELAIVCLPGEVFVDLGLAIKRLSPFRTTLVVELSNCGETCYIPTRVAYAQGSYEVENSTVKPGSGEMLVEAAIGLLREAATAARQAK